jgi:hypothetical protein
MLNWLKSWWSQRPSWRLSKEWRPRAKAGDHCFYITPNGVRVNCVISMRMEFNVYVTPLSEQREHHSSWRSLSTLFVDPEGAK